MSITPGARVATAWGRDRAALGDLAAIFRPAKEALPGPQGCSVAAPNRLVSGQRPLSAFFA
ncbi:MAG: hypothetical protein MJE77_00425 [Proteobacteria bacterium]|nr:hypothetical protein [Pseudomonadota bacterium]